MDDASNCDYGYHIWRERPGYVECVVCHLIEKEA